MHNTYMLHFKSVPITPNSRLFDIHGDCRSQSRLSPIGADLDCRQILTTQKTDQKVLAAPYNTGGFSQSATELTNPPEQSSGQTALFVRQFAIFSSRPSLMAAVWGIDWLQAWV